MRFKHTLPGLAARSRIPVTLTIAVAICAALLLTAAPVFGWATALP
jgi:hypothetical protein